MVVCGRTKVFLSAVALVIGLLVWLALPESPRSVSPTITADSFFGYRLGDACDEAQRKSLERRGHVGARSDLCRTFSAEGLPAGLDSLSLGYTPKTARLCCLTSLKNYEPNVTDAQILGDLETLHELVRAVFTNEVARNPAFDLHDPPHSLYASVENDRIRLMIRASRRPDAICNWINFDVEDRKLVETARREGAELRGAGRDPFGKSEAERIVGMIVSMAMLVVFELVGAMPLAVLGVLAQVWTCKVRRLPVLVPASWLDVLTIAVVPFVWGALEHVGAHKSLSNLCELPIMGLLWGVCYVVRTVTTCRPNPPKAWRGGLITLLVLSAAAASMAVFFPCLPE